ncbi:hypothetical protein M1N22_03500 [Dehalococcoidia bacterium]|nr:hypothetical protein [Dehalococcoidia bacterium]MCL0056663.1 hypothetical protein [Dehalococcoidia bacterium]MCL0064985.1 hypothetical protein [Dehalococcoidia bacterium]
MMLAKKDWILLLLKYAPLDRIHIMKCLFLIWHRSGRKIDNFFDFEPYLYGPCSFEVYTILENLEGNGLVVQPPHPMPQWVNYYLTENGKKEAEEITKKVALETIRQIESVSKEISRLNFYELLRTVYTEAPDFAVNSMFRGIKR